MLLWSGQALSGVGSQVSSVAYPLLALAVTGSPAKAGIVGLAKWIPAAALALPAGLLADRLNRKRLMVACDGAQALAMLSIPIAAALGRVPFALMVAVALVDGAGGIVSFAAERGALRRLVPSEQLGEAAAQNEARSFTAMLAGPSLGGVLFGIGRAVPFMFDAISFAASTVSKLLIRTDFQEARSDTAPGDIWDGVRWLWRRPFFRVCALMWAACSPVLIGLDLLAVVLARHHHAAAALIGVMLGIGAGGGLVGALLAPALQRRLSPRAVLTGENWMIAASLPFLLLAHSPLLLGLILAAATVLTPVSNSVVVSYRVALAPDRLQGRVNAGSALISLSAGWLGPLAVGVLIQSAGSSATILILTGWMLLLSVVGSASSALRHPPERDG